MRRVTVVKLPCTCMRTHLGAGGTVLGAFTRVAQRACDRGRGCGCGRARLRSTRGGCASCVARPRRRAAGVARGHRSGRRRGGRSVRRCRLDQPFGRGCTHCPLRAGRPRRRSVHDRLLRVERRVARADEPRHALRARRSGPLRVGELEASDRGDRRARGMARIFLSRNRHVDDRARSPQCCKCGRAVWHHRHRFRQHSWARASTARSSHIISNTCCLEWISLH